MKWAKSLIRLSNHEVEEVQKRVAEITTRRVAVEMLVSALDAEVAAEDAHALTNAEAGFYLIGFREGAKVRREALLLRLREIAIEESGARDALSEAFETLKKYENVAETARLAAVKEENRRETAELDELGLRKRS